MVSKGMVSKSKYLISENNKGDEYSKTPKNPYILSTGFVSGTLRNHNACKLKIERKATFAFWLILAIYNLCCFDFLLNV